MLILNQNIEVNTWLSSPHCQAITSYEPFTENYLLSD